MMLPIAAWAAVLAPMKEAAGRPGGPVDVCSMITADSGNTLPGPAAGNRSGWIADMKRCRTLALESIGYTDAAAARLYGTERLAWTQRSFAFPMVQGFDRYLWNGTHYTVEAFLADLETRYGGVDAVFLWSVLPTWMPSLAGSIR